MLFEYFYGSQAEQFSFYRIPKVLFTDETLAGISVEAKVLYSFMLDRMSLSVKNCWFDEENRVYIIYTIDDILSDFGCARQKALKLLDELENAITDRTILISVMTVNNEIGTIQPIDEIAQIAKKYNIYFHTDAVQAYMHVPIDVKKSGIHMMSVSSHKLCGPKGTGFLYIADGCDIEKFIYGGKQERDMRAGTENVPGIVGMGAAVNEGFKNMYQKNVKTANVRDYFLSRIENEIEDVRLNGPKPGNERLPGNLNVSFKGIEGETLLVILDMNGICASAGSACNTGEPGISHVIESIGVPKEYADGTIRFTLGEENTISEVDRVMEILKAAVSVLRE